MNISKIKAMVAIAYSDGFFDSRELFLINQRAKELGLNNDEVLNIIRSPHDENFESPVTNQEKLEFMYNLMEIIYADLKVEDSEKKMFVKYLNVLGFSNEIHDSVFDLILSSVKLNLDFKTFYSKHF